ncbi:hypothetical protein BVRB_021020 [Beta vulgaris subsp. vulgaris]|uniref:Lipoyl-binding domain-containing protein n=1 Tax=Beta vulgaris subsp. vulgaris TaxID=3555 RepID=A0A0J8B3Q3_BETVV|nr:hypothetical protein BVRB_021020 [Beta vulgaris subsp. vulgaris]
MKQEDVLSAALYPQVYDEFASFVAKYGDISVLPTNLVFYPLQVGREYDFEIERGKKLFVKLLAIGSLQSNGTREMFWEINGNARSVYVEDRVIAVDKKGRIPADPADPGSLGAPMSGVVIDVRVEIGSEVKVGDPVAILSAMKMEMVVAAPVSGIIGGVAVQVGDSINAGDLIATIKKA